MSHQPKRGRRKPTGPKVVRVRSPRIVRHDPKTEPKAPKPVFVTDLDGTLIREQLLVLLTKVLFERGVFLGEVEDLFREVRLQHRDRKMSFEDYDQRLIEIYSRNVRGTQAEDVRTAAGIVFEKHRDWLYRFTKALLVECHGSHECITITGAMHETVSLLAPYWGLTTFYSTELEVDDAGLYTGDYTALPVRDKGAKLLDHVALRGGTLAGSIAIGDTMSDAAMLRAVEIPVVFNPDDKLMELAMQHGWPIVIERKDCVYVIHGGFCEAFNAEDAREAVRHVLTLRPHAAR